jgi:hypothetical protein
MISSIVSSEPRMLPVTMIMTRTYTAKRPHRPGGSDEASVPLVTARDVGATSASQGQTGESQVKRTGLIDALIAMLCASCATAEQRFKTLDGPLDNTVIYPADFGVDVSDLSVPVRPLLNAVSSTNLRTSVDAIDVSRPGMSAAGVAAANYIDAQLASRGYTVQRQNASDGTNTMPNVFTDKTGSVCPSKIFVVGGHYDSVAAGPGADDDASGVAVMLEMARVLHDTSLPITVRFAGFALEETGLNGSFAMANALHAANADVVGMVSLEMLGFTTTGKDPFIGSEQNFLAQVGNPNSAPLAKIFGAAAYHYLPFFFAPAAVVDPAVVGDVLRSDHAPFWLNGYQALLLTDLANFRNPNYHKATDTIDTLNFNFMAQSARSTIAGLVAFATLDADNNGQPDVCES